MTVSFAEATAAARRIQKGDYPEPAKWPILADARLLAGFVLAGDTERLRTALDVLRRVVNWPYPAPNDSGDDYTTIGAYCLPDWLREEVEAALAERGV